MQWSIGISLINNLITAPFELVKVRAQLLQEGRRIHGGNLERGAPAVRIFYEMIDKGYGIRGLWTG
jgi:hypothetical protein